MSKSKVVNFTLPVPLVEQIKTLAERSELSQSRLVRMILGPGLSRFEDAWKLQGHVAVASFIGEEAMAVAKAKAPDKVAALASVQAPAPAAPPAPAAGLFDDHKRHHLGRNPSPEPAPSSAPAEQAEPPYPAGMAPIRLRKFGDQSVWAQTPDLLAAYGVAMSQLEVVIDVDDDLQDYAGSSWASPLAVREVSNLGTDRARARQLDDWLAYQTAKLQAHRMPDGPKPPARKID